MSVSIEPGGTRLTVTSFGPSSRAATFVNAASADLVAAYALRIGVGTRSAIVIMRPPLTRWAKAALLAINGARTLTFRSALISASEISIGLAQSRNPCIVDEDIKPTQFGDRRIHRGLNSRGVRAVGLYRHSSTPLRLNGADDLGGALRSPHK
jgi:hypothetical protein